MSKINPEKPAETIFRKWIDIDLKNARGQGPLWPPLFGQLLDGQFQTQKESKASYAGEVFIDRDLHPAKVGSKEEHQVAALYRNNCTLFLADQTEVLLLGFEWPNQGGNAEKKRRADLVGMTKQGQLVVFEAKVETGSYPLIALMEGLDYLACLLRKGNFSKIVKGFNKWKAKTERISNEFSEVVPSRDEKPILVVLAPKTYYTGTHTRSTRSQDWPLFAKLGNKFMDSVHIEFATTDFKSQHLGKAPLPKPSAD